MPEQIGEYRVIQQLGMGGQGAVFLAESPTGMRVAIKLLHERFAADPDDRRRFLREAQVAATVAPFCTARVVGTGLFREQPYIVSEYIPGPSLLQLVRTEGPRTGGGLHRLAISTLTALASIHRAGVVHRDFKPGNVILGPEGPVVIDFGIARALGAMATATQVSGTPAFMSPELLSDQPATPASDIFSWGVTMVFAATGRVPFSGDTIPATFHAILHKDPDLTGVPEPLRALVAACLAKDPAHRPSADHVLRELTNAQRLPDAPADLSGMSTPTGTTGHTSAPTDPTGHPPTPTGASGHPPTPTGASGHPPAGIPGHGATPPGMPGHTAIGMPDDMAKGTTGDTMPPALSLAATDTGLGKARQGRRRTLLIGGSVLVAAAVAVGAVFFVPALLSRDTGDDRPAALQAAPPSANSPRPALDLASYGIRDTLDDFNGAAGSAYGIHRPTAEEKLPAARLQGDRIVAEGDSPYYGWFVLPGAPSSGETVSLLILGSFADTREPEDSVFVGRIKDSGNYVGAWYNNTRKEMGIDLRINGEFRHPGNSAPIALKTGDKIALVVSDSGKTITSYAESGGVWRRMTTISAQLPGEETERMQWRHGFALRATKGTISLEAAEGRSR